MRPPAPALDVSVLPDLAAISAAAAARVVACVAAAVTARGECAVALAGGSTPRTLYEMLAGESFRGRVAWERLRVFWGDERCVPPEDPQSNFRMAREALLTRVSVPPDRVHRMPADRPDLAGAAEEYERALRRYLPAAPGGWPRFDLVLLGLGDNAHTASLFPGTSAVREARRAVMALYVAEVGANRMTVTAPVLNCAAEVMFLVSGAAKADAVWRVLEGPWEPDAVPAQVVRPAGGTLRWLLDAPAAARLTPRAGSPSAGRGGAD